MVPFPSTPKESRPEHALPPPWILFPFPTASSSYLAVVILAAEMARLAGIVLLVGTTKSARVVLRAVVHHSLRGGLVNSSDGNGSSSRKAGSGEGSEKGGDDSELHVGNVGLQSVDLDKL
jgi:hypothetical protein